VCSTATDSVIKGKGDIFVKEHSMDYFNKMLDDVDEFIRWYYRKEKWKKRAKLFKRRIKVNFD
jgi:hypothetical protein